jgi:prevent-host-death family protein
MRELRHRLREYLVRVESGSSFEVTVFGRPVAQLTPPAGRSTLESLVAEGKVTPPVNPDTSTLPPRTAAVTEKTATEWLLDERRSDPR